MLEWLIYWFIFFTCISVLPVCMSVLGCVPLKLSYRQLWGALWVLGIELRSPERLVCVPGCWAISLSTYHLKQKSAYHHSASPCLLFWGHHSKSLGQFFLFSLSLAHLCAWHLFFSFQHLSLLWRMKIELFQPYALFLPCAHFLWASLFFYRGVWLWIHGQSLHCD